MKQYLKLVNFELNRFMKMYGLLLLVVLLLQTITTVISSKLFMNERLSTLEGESVDSMNFSLLDVTSNFGFIAPIFIGVAALLFYLFFIWYRDWLARNAFIYRLLTLPTARMTVYFAKVTTIMITVFGLLAYQIAVLKFLSILLKWFVPKVYRDDLSIVETIFSSPYLNIIIQNGVAEFLVSLFIGLSFVIVVFTMILLERSFKLKGIGLGILYFILCMLWVFTPGIIQITTSKLQLYAGEMFWLEGLLVLIVVTISLWLSRYLLNHKITV